MLSQFRKNAEKWASHFAATHPNTHTAESSFSAHFFGALKEKKERAKEEKEYADAEEEEYEEYVDDEYMDECEYDDYEDEFSSSSSENEETASA